MRSIAQLLLLSLAVLFPSSGRSGDPNPGPNLGGRWWTPLGVLKFEQAGTKVVGVVSFKCPVCPFRKGEQVFQGVLLEDSLAGKFRYCLKGKGCEGDGWASLVLLVAREGRVLSGAAHFKTSEGCEVGGKGPKDGIVMRKLRPVPPKPPGPPAPVEPKTPTAPSAPDQPGEAKPAAPGVAVIDDSGDKMEEEVKPTDPKQYEGNAGSWQGLMTEGAELMNSGFFERARRKFLQATELDPTRPEAFNGIGVTYYARNDYDEALNWYKKSLEVNPNFGDAFYNMAAIYAIQKKAPLAFRYLEIAALNNFVQPDVLGQDPDFTNLRSDPRYQKILEQMKKGQR